MYISRYIIIFKARLILTKDSEYAYMLLFLSMLHYQFNITY